jgi:predicted flap endonuclease-1-like 5' DNA nuclease
MARLIDIEGIGPVYANKLQEAGIRGTKSLLDRGTTRQDRKLLAEKTGIDEGLILEWLNHVDLMRIQGVGGEYSDLLEEAGVDTVVELAQRNAANLYKTLQEVNEKKKLVRRLPTQNQVAGWIVQAEKLPKVLTY